MRLVPTSLTGLVVIEPEVFADRRGYFYESYNREKFQALGIDATFSQDNHSFSHKGVLRGLHFQMPPNAQAKLVRCTRGKLFDVAVDLRAGSPTYKQWFGIELSEENKKMLFVPIGFAHGFYALEDCELLYKCSAVYNKECDGNVRWSDPELAVAWPVTGEPIVSDRDAAAPMLRELNLRF